MMRAIGQARLAAQRGEVPIGAVIVRGDALIAASHDGKEVTHDPTAHAEVLALRRAAQVVGDWRIEEATLYVTLEPCPMCAGALIQARIARLVYGASNPRWGAFTTESNVIGNPAYNHRVEVTSGVLADECAEILQKTFRRYREKSSSGAEPTKGRKP